MSIQNLSEYTFHSRYAKYIPEKKRRETWQEAVDRVFNMHEEFFLDVLKDNPEFKEYFDLAKSAYSKKRILGSQRALQFGGQPTLRKNMRMFNCSTTHVNRPRAFQEAMWVLLCGTGLGFSVQKHHIKQLPDLIERKEGVKTFKPEDSIEGWSDCIGVLINSFFPENKSVFPEYSGYEVEFDLSNIRPEGAFISGGFKAPGPNGLARSLGKIKDLIENRLDSEDFKSGEFKNKLRPIDCFDCIAHSSDAVLSGGVRRSALLTLFSFDDKKMAESKTGNWFVDNPQRARSNNSAALNKTTTTREQFAELMKSTRHFGEPGFVWVDDKEMETVYNPCIPLRSKLLTPDGITSLENVKEGDAIWSSEGWTRITKKWKTGNKPVYKYATTSGYIESTDNHEFVSGGVKIQAKEASSVDSLTGPDVRDFTIDPQFVIDGLVLGDGTYHKASENILLLIGKDDQDYFASEISGLIDKSAESIQDYGWFVMTTIKGEDIPYTYKRNIPERFIHSKPCQLASFLRGLYSANGSICGSRVTLKTTSFDLVQDVQVALSSLGISSYYTTNKEGRVKFENGDYLCRESYDVNISRDIDIFESKINFIQKYKSEKLRGIVSDRYYKQKRKREREIIERTYLGTEDVYDITVDNKSHTFWCNGFDISNCCEIGMIPIDENGEHGVQVCNLTEINGKYCSTKERFFEACKASAIIGTMQAAYTKFDYLTEASENICNLEALLGCSITGINDNPEILLNPEIQKEGAELIKKVNREVAAMIGINPSARTTCVKPSGSTSCLLQTASGIHPHHAKRYLRRVQANKSEFPLQYFKKHNAIAVEESVWSSNKTDEVITFVCEVPDGAKTKNQLSAIDLLEQVKLTQQNWVEGGTNLEIGHSKRVKHNVSNTISILNEDEWVAVEEYIWENRRWFAGISLLSSTGDLDYPQAPFATVLTPTELFREYGNASVFASGLIVDGLKAFDENLWSACDSVLGLGEKIEEEMEEPSYPKNRSYNALSEYFAEKENYENWFLKKDWIRRVKQFSERYFDGDIKKTTYSMKHVALWKSFVDLSREYKEVDWSNAIEEKESLIAADTMAAASCAGGKCLIDF